jgi:hypothetical protein
MIYKFLLYSFNLFQTRLPIPFGPALGSVNNPIIIRNDEPLLPCYVDFGYHREHATLSWKAGNECDSSPQKMQEHSLALAQSYKELKKFRHNSNIVDLDEAIKKIDLIKNNVGWADEYFINEYMRSLVQKYPNTSIQAIVSGMIPEGVWSENYLKQLLRTSGEAKALRKAEMILLPINSQSHWTIVGIEKHSDNHFNVYCVDGLNRHDDHEVFFERAEEFLTHLYSNQDLSVQFHSIGIPMQNNNFDCGYITCIVADRLAKGSEGIKQLQSVAPFQHERCNYQASRSVVLQRLAEYAADIIQAYTFEEPTFVGRRRP